MKIAELTPQLGVTGQITPADVAAIAAAGYRVIINNRPDGEEGAQPAGAAIAAAAAAAGLAYHYLPVTAADFPGAGFAEMTALLNDPSRPVLAFCRSGNRCTNLWIASRPEAERPAAQARARELGFDVAMAGRYLQGGG